MSLFRLKKTVSPRILVKKRCFATALVDDEEYTCTPQYPPILDLSFKKKLERKKAAIHEELRNVKTVEEKQIKMNMPRYYGFKSYMLLENKIPYNNLTLAQHATRTHLIKNNELPDSYKDVNVDDLVDSVKGNIEEVLLMELDIIRRTHDLQKQDLDKEQVENIVTSSLTRQINRIVVNKLAKKHQHLSLAEVDLDPRIESSWFVGGMSPPEQIKKKRSNIVYLKDYVNKTTDRLMYYIGSPALTLRSELPLAPVVPFSDAENPDLDVPFFQYDPRVVGTATEHRHIVNIPGFWPGDSHSFGLLSYHKRGHMLNRSERFDDAQDNKEAIDVQAILASFAWLHAQANHLGFTTFNEITYPLVTQTIITNGKVWSFYVYQLNTMLLHAKNTQENPRRNICWASEELQLFEEIVDGKVIGLNEDVLRKLLKLYANEPKERLGINLRPYLSQDEKLSADYEDPEKREWLEREYKYLMSNRPRFREFEEIYSWEKIYKIDNKTRFMDKKLRFFELFKVPQNRTLDDRLPNYIPRKLRPDLPRHKGRYAKEFFP